MDPTLVDPIVVDITVNKIFRSCFKTVFKGKTDLQAGDDEMQSLKLCSKNLVESFGVVSEGFQNYIKSIPTAKDYSGAEA